MSLRLLTLVWERAPYKDGALLLLLALADFSDDEGKSWPAVETVAKKARMGERHARRILRQFEEDGIVSIEKRGTQHRPNVYAISVAKLKAYPDLTICPPCDEPDLTPASPDLTPMSARPDTQTPRTVRTIIEPSGPKFEKEEARELQLEIDSQSFVVWFIKLLKDTGAPEPRLTDAIRDNWAGCYEKMIRIDRRTKKEVAEVCRWARSDNFWKTNFLSPVKLRLKNDGGIMYHDVFLNHIANPRHANESKHGASRALGANSNIAGFEEYERRMAAKL